MRPAGQAPAEVAGERLRRRRFVEDGRVLLPDVAAQPLRCELEPLPVEPEGREEPGRQLVGMHVPALVDAAAQMSAHEAGVEAPRLLDRRRIPDREDVRRPVGEVDAGAGDGDHHLILREVRDGMLHRLVGGGHAHRRRVVVRAVVERGDASRSGVEDPGHGHGAVGAEDELRGLDLDFEGQCPVVEAVLLLEVAQRRDHGRDLVGGAHLRQGEDEPLGQGAVGGDDA
ncbi:Uncharacterised protein [Mycobacteroides abscessus subsp. abscessus]|nr:Uncharacterised protein [Mycobacteroides abscessus subsp. abscessus]